MQGEGIQDNGSFPRSHRTVPIGSSGAAVEGERGGIPAMLPGSDRRDGGSGEKEESRGWLPDPSVLRSPGADDTPISRRDR